MILRYSFVVIQVNCKENRGIRINIDTLIKLEQSDNERSRGIAKLAIILDMKYQLMVLDKNDS